MPYGELVGADQIGSNFVPCELAGHEQLAVLAHAHPIFGLINQVEQPSRQVLDAAFNRNSGMGIHDLPPDFYAIGYQDGQAACDRLKDGNAEALGVRWEDEKI